MPRGMSLHERFWYYLVKKSDDECWDWKGPKSSGYGELRAGGKGSPSIRMHRLSWEIHFGPIPAGKHVCHTCDNKICNNPKHLFIGSAKDNMADKERKRRGGHKKKLSESDIENIKLLSKTMTGRNIAKLYKCSEASVSRIIHNYQTIDQKGHPKYETYKLVT